MQKAIRTGWLVLSVTGMLVALYLLITESPTHSKFYMFMLAAAGCFLLYRKAGTGNAGKARPASKKKK